MTIRIFSRSLCDELTDEVNEYLAIFADEEIEDIKFSSVEGDLNVMVVIKEQKKGG